MIGATLFDSAEGYFSDRCGSKFLLEKGDGQVHMRRAADEEARIAQTFESLEDVLDIQCGGRQRPDLEQAACEEAGCLSVEIRDTMARVVEDFEDTGVIGNPELGLGVGIEMPCHVLLNWRRNGYTV